MSVLKTVTGSRMSVQNPTPLHEVNGLSQLKAAASKETTSVVGNTTTSDVSSVNSAQVGQTGTTVPMHHVYQTLQEDVKLFSKSKRHRTRKMKEKLRQKVAKCNPHKYSNQAGVADQAERVKKILMDLSSVQNIPMSSSAIKHIEQLILLYFSVTRAVDVSHALSIIGLYLETFFEKSICESVLDKLLELSVSCQAGDKPDWLQLLKQAQTNWKLVVANEGFGHLSNVLSIMLGLGLCNNADLNFNIAGMQLFSIQAKKRQVCAIDLGDAIFSTVVFFVEGGYECFKKGSISPLLHGNFDFDSMEEKIQRCENLYEYALTGDLRAKENMDPNDYDHLLRETLEELTTQLKIVKNPMVERIFRDKRDRLSKMRVAFDQKRVSGGLREDPYGMGFFGNSGVGKSSVSQILMIVVLMHNGYSAADDRMITMNESDKYDSNYFSDINGVHMDDIGNSKSEFVEKAPTQKYLELHNNVRQYANKAEAELKGKVSKEPKVVNSTRNVFMKHAIDYSNKPVSILRREDFVAVVRVREQYATHNRLDQSKVFAAFPDDLIPDCWEIDLYEFYEDEPESSDLDVVGEPRSKIIEWKGRSMENVGIHDVIKFACERSAKHFQHQRDLVAKQTNLAEQLPWCKECKLPLATCGCQKHCEEHNDSSESSEEESVSSQSEDAETYEEYCARFDNEDQFGNFLYPIVSSYVCGKVKKVTRFGEAWLEYFETESADCLVDTLTWFENSPWVCWTNWLPRGCLDNEYVEKFILAQNSRTIRQSVLSYYYLCAFASCVIALFSWFYSPLFGVGLFYIAWRVANMVELQKKWLYDRIRESNDAMPAVFKHHRDSLVNYVTWSCIALSFIYLLSKTWKLMRIVQEDQGNLMPTSFEEIEERDAEAEIEQQIAKEMNWTTIQAQPIPSHHKASTSSFDETCAKVRKNLGQISYLHKGERYGCDIFFVESNVGLIPQHIWKYDEIVATVCTGKDGLIPRKFNFWLSRTQSVDIPDTDFSLVYVPNGGSWQNLSDYLPESAFRDVPGYLQSVQVSKSGLIRSFSSSLHMKNGRVGNSSKRFTGSSYELEFNTFVGLCMAPIVTRTNQRVIGGFHLGGVNGNKQGISGLLTRAQYDAARDHLSLVPGVTLVASSGTMKTELYDKKFFISSKPHEKSPVHNIPKENNMNYYGSCIGGAKYFSAVTQLPICESVEQVCGVENQFGAPKFHLGDAWQKSLDVSCNPSIGVEGKLLAQAVQDYTFPIIDQIREIEGVADLIRPLSEMEVVCGIDGKRFIDKMKGNTSVGYPLSGPKEKYLEPLDPAEFPEFACPMKLDEKFWIEARRMEEEYVNGRRCYFVFKGCLKDEPTKKTKDKVRVFQASSIAAQLLIRKYFLPIARVLSLFPLLTECAVGINTLGPEFSALIEHMRKFGTDRILAGDYSKYDLRMAAQLTLAAFDVLIMIAKAFGYSERDLIIMKGIATDVCYPVTAFNGDLIELLGSNPSGQNLTVYINSIVNSLLMRSAYFQIFEGRQSLPSFRSVCAMGTYGDDVKGSVKQGFGDFNHVSYAAFLKERDMIFTMPDKESTPVPFMKDEDADFLKRGVRWSEELQLWQGPLTEESIFKSLMVVLKSKAVSLEEQSIQNIDGALREWFVHGREMYETRRQQMKEVAERHGLTMSCHMLTKSYDDCLEVYRRRYKWQTHLLPDPVES